MQDALLSRQVAETVLELKDGVYETYMDGGGEDHIMFDIHDPAHSDAIIDMMIQRGFDYMSTFFNDEGYFYNFTPSNNPLFVSPAATVSLKQGANDENRHRCIAKAALAAVERLNTIEKFLVESK